jgi:hypothetical protein
LSFGVLAATRAVAIRGGIEAAADDRGARAAIMVHVPGGACSGLVYGDSFVITAGHCLADHDLKSAVRPDQLTITYGRSLKDPNAMVRKAAAVAIEDNFLKQFSAWLDVKAAPPEDDMPINQEDIGLIRIARAYETDVKKSPTARGVSPCRTDKLRKFFRENVAPGRLP